MKPSDCILAFGIPTCESDFIDAKDDEFRDFVTPYSWGKYHKEIVSHLEEVEPYFKQLEVRVIHRLKLSDFKVLLESNPKRVIILFSHWKEDSIEFFSGMASSDAIVNEVPLDFEGIIDLCVCHPNNLWIKLRNLLPPSALIKFTDVTNTPYKWLYFYWVVFTILDNSEVSYSEALKQGVQAFAERK